MEEIQRARIKSVYGDIAGILSQIPLTTDKFTVVYRQTGDQYNRAVDELTTASQTDYSRYKLTPADRYSESAYILPVTRARIGSLVKRLEEEYGFGTATQSQTSPIVLTINQNQQVTLNITPIQQIIDTAGEDVKQELQELKHVLETSKDAKQASGILNKIQQKSWEVFMRVLPYVLEQLGKHH